MSVLFGMTCMKGGVHFLREMDEITHVFVHFIS